MPIGLLDLQREFECVGAEVRKAVDEVFASHQYINGPQVREIESWMAKLSGCRFGVGVSNGTDALLVALMALGIGPGDEVITTPFTFFATAGCIHRLGATPVFADIEPDTFNIDPQAVAAAITPRTKAIIPVHLYGQCADMTRIMKLADRHGLAVIEDAAQAIGATHHGQPAGSFGICGCYSFYPTKNLGTCGEGGMIVSRDEAFADRCAKLRNHGEVRRYHHEMVGGNFRLDTLKAAVLLVKAKYLAEWTAKRRAHARRLDELLADAAVQTPVVRPENSHVYHQYTILCDERNEVQAQLARNQIGTGVYYPIPLHLQKCFESLGGRLGQFPRAESAAARVLSLPVHHTLTDSEVERVGGEVLSLTGAQVGSAG